MEMDAVSSSTSIASSSCVGGSIAWSCCFSTIDVRQLGITIGGTGAHNSGITSSTHWIVLHLLYHDASWLLLLLLPTDLDDDCDIVLLGVIVLVVVAAEISTTSFFSLNDKKDCILLAELIISYMIIYLL